MRKKNLKIQMLAGNSLNSYFHTNSKDTMPLVKTYFNFSAFLAENSKLNCSQNKKKPASMGSSITPNNLFCPFPIDLPKAICIES